MFTWCSIETVNLFATEGLLKVTGMLVCIFGAVLMVFYRGPSIIGDGSVDLATQAAENLMAQPKHIGWLASRLTQFGLTQWNIGVLCLIGNCFCMGAFLALQVLGNKGVVSYYIFGTYLLRNRCRKKSKYNFFYDL